MELRLPSLRVREAKTSYCGYSFNSRRISLAPLPLKVCGTGACNACGTGVCTQQTQGHPFATAPAAALAAATHADTPRMKDTGMKHLKDRSSPRARKPVCAHAHSLARVHTQVGNGDHSFFRCVQYMACMQCCICMECMECME